MLQYFVILFAVGVGIGEVYGHGRMIQPPSRASMFRFGFNSPPDYNDNERNCGGFGVQQALGGKCGICGNLFNGSRDHEAGGRYANGIITGSYVSGQNIRVVIEITANHLGYFLFKLCPNNDVTRVATQECLDQYALELADGSGTKFYIDSRLGIFEIDLTLPDGLVCSQCVLQWMYRCGNNHGTAENGTVCLGCGPQEEFYACSDVEILSNVGQPNTQTPVSVSQTQVAVSQTTPVTVSQTQDGVSQTTPVTVSQTTPVTVSQTTPVSVSQTQVGVSQTTPVTVSQTQVGVSQTTPVTVSQTTVAVSSTTDDDQTQTPSTNMNCYGTESYRASEPNADRYCKYNCMRGFCPQGMCQCTDDDPPTENCVANGSYQGDPNMDVWCRTNCNLGFCPASHCICPAV